jgi:hypothetical protein
MFGSYAEIIIRCVHNLISSSTMDRRQVLKADGSTDTLPLPPIRFTELRLAMRNQDQACSAD